MRIISGTARGRRLKTLEGMDVRPTTEKVKEAIFSSIQFDLPQATVLDLFAGSGQLGLEALSRGAKRAYLIDHSPKALSVIRENVAAAGFSEQAEVIQTEAAAFLKSSAPTMQWDLVFLDPPCCCWNTTLHRMERLSVNTNGNWNCRRNWVSGGKRKRIRTAALQ